MVPTLELLAAPTGPGTTSTGTIYRAISSSDAVAALPPVDARVVRRIVTSLLSGVDYVDLDDHRVAEDALLTVSSASSHRGGGDFRIVVQAARDASSVLAELVADGDVGEARALVRQIGSMSRLRGWREFLREPVVIELATASGQGSRTNMEWLQKNRRAFQGRWVAVKDGELLDSDSSRTALQRRLNERDDLKGVLVARV